MALCATTAAAAEAASDVARAAIAAAEAAAEAYADASAMASSRPRLSIATMPLLLVVRNMMSRLMADARGHGL
jgi:hypothetical protein